MHAFAGLSVTDVVNLEAFILNGQLTSTMIIGDRRAGIRVRSPLLPVPDPPPHLLHR